MLTLTMTMTKRFLDFPFISLFVFISSVTITMCWWLILISSDNISFSDVFVAPSNALIHQSQHTPPFIQDMAE
jgi:uncharacterized membrane protein